MFGKNLSEKIAFEDFDKVDIRAGKIIEVEDFPRAQKPSYRVKIDFGSEIGVKNSSLQAKRDYTREDMLGRYVICVVNFEPKNIAGFMSEVLVLGVPHEDGGLSLLEPGRRPVPLGARAY
ncbi:MAG: tRNA-binding protein [Thermovirgaceae bacterium]